MDTFKEKQLLEDLYTRGQVPWELWKTAPRPSTSVAGVSRRSSEAEEDRPLDA
jgi:hypothetical protein